MKPDRIAQYEILEPLGSGAHGTAYRARDTRLDRPVVIKLLHAGREAGGGDPGARMLEEARLASAIEHPNVCAIYEVGEYEGRPFTVMQYVPGRTLRELMAEGTLGLRFILSVGIQVADGLAAAHRLGILHRDLKPENVMINDGAVKILDFGLARRVARPEAADAAGGGESGGRSDRFGTTAYMAPEQLALRRSSEQSDIFALGVILYEMIAGEHPFVVPNADPAVLVESIRTRQPVPPRRLRPEVSEGLEAVVLKALAKQPANRFRYARDVAEALKTEMRALGLETGLVPGESSALLPSPAPAGREKRGLLSELVERLLPARPSRVPPNSIATLPFQDLDSPGGSGLYGFTLSNAVATRLARVPEVVVRPLSAYLSVADRERDPLEVGEELRVERVLLGSFTRAEGRLVLHWQLLDVESGAMAHGGEIAMEATELAAVQAGVADEIVSALRTSGALGSPPKRDRAHTTIDDLDDPTREQYLAARALLASFALRSGSQDDLDRVFAAYEAVLERAPRFAPAHAGLGTAYLRSARTGLGGVEHLRTAERHLNRALQLDPDLVEARLYRASTLIWEGEKDGARLDLQDLLRNAAPDADIYLAAAVILQLDGLLDEALRVQRAALNLNPAVAPRAYYYRARVFLFQGRPEPARKELEKGLALEPAHTLMRHVLGFIQLQEGDLDGAIRTLEGVLRDAPGLRIIRPTLAMGYARAGRFDDAAALITDEVLDAAAADAETAYRLATYFVVVDDTVQALAWLRLAIYLGNENFPWFAANPAWVGLSDNPEMRDILTDLEEVHRMNRVRWQGTLDGIPA